LTLSPSQASYESKLVQAEACLEKFGTDVVVGTMYTGQGVDSTALYAGRKTGHAAATVGHDIHDFGVSAKNRVSKSDAVIATAWDVGLSLDSHSAAGRTKICDIMHTPNSLSPEFHEFLRDSTAPDFRLHSARSHRTPPRVVSSLLSTSKQHKLHSTNAQCLPECASAIYNAPTHARDNTDAKMHALSQTRARHEVAQAEKMAVFARAQAMQTHANSHACALHAQAAQDAHAHAQAQTKARFNSLSHAQAMQTHANSHAYALHTQAAQDAHAHAQAQTKARFNSLSHAHAQAQTQAHYHALAHAQAAAYDPHSGRFGIFPYNQPSSLYHVFRWWSNQLGGRLNVLGKIVRAQMDFGGWHTTHTHSHQNMQFLSSPNRHSITIAALFRMACAM